MNNNVVDISHDLSKEQIQAFNFLVPPDIKELLIKENPSLEDMVKIEAYKKNIIQVVEGTRKSLKSLILSHDAMEAMTKINERLKIAEVENNKTLSKLKKLNDDMLADEKRHLREIDKKPLQVESNRDIDEVIIRMDKAIEQNDELRSAVIALNGNSKKQFWLGVLSAIISGGFVALLGWIISIIFKTI